MKKKLKPTEREFMENALVDSVRLRAALLLACTELTEGDPIEAWGLAEEFYDQAPKLLKVLEGDTKLPCGPAQVLPFPVKQD